MAKMTKMVKVEIDICDYCGREISEENEVYDVLSDDRIICCHCADHVYFQCPECEEYYHLDKSVHHWMLGESYCPTCAKKLAHELLELIKDVEES